MIRSMAFLAAATLCVGLAAPASAATPPDPRNDSFYAVPSTVASAAPGAVLNSRPITPALFGAFTARASGWQVLYRTTDNNGVPTATVATILVPQSPPPVAGRPRPVVSYPEAEDSNSRQCAPSYSLVDGAPPDNTVAQAEMLIISGYLSLGDVVVVPDYEGPNSLYTVGVMAGQATLDGIRAAKAFAPAGIAATAPIGITGYSGGALATEWAAQLQPTYAPDVHLSAVVAGGVPVNVAHVADHIDSGPSLGALDGIALNGITGEYKAYPQLSAPAAQFVTPAGRAIIAKLNTVCNSDAITDYPFTPYSVMFSVPNPLTAIPQLQQIIAANTLGAATPAKVPTYLYQSVNDELTVTPDVDALVKQDCAAGVPIDYQRDVLSEHISLVATGAPAAIQWMQGTLLGTRKTTSCSTTTTVSTLASSDGGIGLLKLLLGLLAVFS